MFGDSGMTIYTDVSIILIGFIQPGLTSAPQTCSDPSNDISSGINCCHGYDHTAINHILVD